MISGFASFQHSRGESSHYTGPGRVDCVTGRSDMICDMYAICGKLFVMCAMCVMGRKAIILWAGRHYVWAGRRYDV